MLSVVKYSGDHKVVQVEPYFVSQFTYRKIVMYVYKNGSTYRRLPELIPNIGLIPKIILQVIDLIPQVFVQIVLTYVV